MNNQAMDAALVTDIKQLIQSAKQRAASAVNAEITMLYWLVGSRISKYLLQGERAEYGRQVITELSKQLTEAFGRGWSQKQLHHCLRFAETFPDEQIVSAVRRQLSWTHLKSLIYIDEALKREFYIRMAIEERWSTRTLSERIGSLLFERTAISKKPEETLVTELEMLREKGEVNQDLVLKDPYVLDFLDLNDRYLEKGLEDAILRELEQFLLELGTGFTFVARQKRIQIDDDDFYIDLLFYNRKLKRLVAIDLKVGRFKAEYKGQMELYLRWLAKHEQEEGEQPPLGIILCAGKKQEQIELLELDQSGIHVAEYITALPPMDVFEQRLHQAINNAKQRLEHTSTQNKDVPDHEQ
ncbi:PDDEXK nuclease domain-containing protein [Litoribacillus peritrichatus]|uniref:PDDEXK nuclease domain-containing protein n=1 Tax=Litoribacillus peritrichatus TaxID=718191 RepID=A0ABP7M6P6_9GAMM